MAARRKISQCQRIRRVNDQKASESKDCDDDPTSSSSFETSSSSLCLSASDLWKSNDNVVWQRELSTYKRVLDKFVSLKKNQKTREELLELDEWLHDVLPAQIHQRNPPHMTWDEIQKVVKWKLNRGVFRPRLTQLVQSNSKTEVVRITSAAFACFTSSLSSTASSTTADLLVSTDSKNTERKDSGQRSPRSCVTQELQLCEISELKRQVKESLKHLCSLKGVGPATASAFLSSFSPEWLPFMLDECLAVVTPAPIKYSVQEYLNLLEEVRLKSEVVKLSTREVIDTIWCTSVRVQLGLEDMILDTSSHIEEENVENKGKSSSADSETSTEISPLLTAPVKAKNRMKRKANEVIPDPQPTRESYLRNRKNP